MAAHYLSLVLVASLTSGVTGKASVTEIVGNLQSFRTGLLELFDTASTTLKELGQDEDASMAEKWSNDWLSVFGTSKGLTGLASDFVLNHLGRSSYHSKNGPLIEAIRKASNLIPNTIDSDSVQEFRNAMLDICMEGKKLFKKDGALHTMHSALQDLLLRKASSDVLFKSVTANKELYRVFKFLSGDTSMNSPVPSSNSDSEL